MSAELQRLSALIDRLNTTPVQGWDEANEKAKAHSRRVISNMMANGGTYGETSGWLPWLNGPDAQKRLREVNNDLGAHVSMVNHTLDYWFQRGEPVPPHYPNRIAVILRKMKRNDLEVEFLRAFARHFLSHSGGAGHSRFNDRIRKVIGDNDG